MCGWLVGIIHGHEYQGFSWIASSAVFRTATGIEVDDMNFRCHMNWIRPKMDKIDKFGVHPSGYNFESFGYDSRSVIVSLMDTAIRDMISLTHSLPDGRNLQFHSEWNRVVWLSFEDDIKWMYTTEICQDLHREHFVFWSSPLKHVCATRNGAPGIQ